MLLENFHLLQQPCQDPHSHPHPALGLQGVSSASGMWFYILG